MMYGRSKLFVLAGFGITRACFGQVQAHPENQGSNRQDFSVFIPMQERFSDKPELRSGECGPLHYRARWRVAPHDFNTYVELSDRNGRSLKKITTENELQYVDCVHRSIKGARTIELIFASGGSGVGVDWYIFRVNPFNPLLQISLWTHADLVSPVEFQDLDHDGQNEVIVRNGSLGCALCESCDYDADTVEYLLCYRDGKFHECAREHPDYFRGLVEKGLKKLADPRQRRHRLAWSLYLLFHAEEIGEADAAWARLQSALPADFIGKVESRRERVAKALRERDRQWSSGD